MPQSEHALGDATFPPSYRRGVIPRAMIGRASLRGGGIVSAELIASVPKTVAGMIAYSKAHEPKAQVAPAPTPKL
jgi:hypothetical protein